MGWSYVVGSSRISGLLPLILARRRTGAFYGRSMDSLMLGWLVYEVSKGLE